MPVVVSPAVRALTFENDLMAPTPAPNPPPVPVAATARPAAVDVAANLAPFLAYSFNFSFLVGGGAMGLLWSCSGA
jgi:hypothetical protein